MERLKNWAGNLTYGAAEVLRPTSVTELSDVVRDANKIRAVGSRHSFNDIADTEHTLVSLDNLNQVLSIDPDARTVTVEGGVTYGKLGPALQAHGLALPNLASLPHISVAGACATATHGSGQGNGNLATSVVAMEIVRPNGDIQSISKNSTPWFKGAVVHLGALGIVANITLAAEPTYQVRQDVYLDLPFEDAIANFDAIEASGYSVSFFTEWAGPSVNQLWIKNLVSPGKDMPMPDSFFGAKKASTKQHPIIGMAVENATDQNGVPGPWNDRLAHFRAEFTPSGGDELQSEFYVPRQLATAALQAVNAMRDEISPLLLTSEIRAIASDELWMSPCYHQDSIAIHFTWRPMTKEVLEVLPRIDAALRPFSPKPHWGKIFTMPIPEIQSRFPQFAAFRDLVSEFDPAGKFRNPFIDRLLA